MKRRTLLQGALLGLLLPVAAHAKKEQLIVVYKTATCGCCHDWVTYLQKNGFKTDVRDVPDTAPYRQRHGVPKELASCHTGVIEGYALEGHVPVADIRRLLAERPKARGLSVPGMVTGSPGMEVEGSRRDAYSVVLFADDGKTRIFSRYAAQS